MPSLPAIMEKESGVGRSQDLGLGHGDRCCPHSCPSFTGRFGGYLVGGGNGDEGLRHGLGGHLIGGFHGGDVFGYGVRGALVGGGHDDARR